MGAATKEMLFWIKQELGAYPEGQQLVRDVLGLPDPTPAPAEGSPPASSASGSAPTSGQVPASGQPSADPKLDPVLPVSVSIEPTEGYLTLQPVGVVIRSPQSGFLRLRVDISPLHRQLQEVHYHLQEHGYPHIVEHSNDQCLNDEGTFISLHQALMAGKGGPTIGQLNETHAGPHVQGQDLQENCTLKEADLNLLPGNQHYAHDFSMQLLLRQATKCVSSVDQNLLRFTVGKRWGNTKATRDVLQLLGVGGAALGVVNRWHLDRLQGQMNQVSHQVEALVGEQRTLSKITGALIDSQAEMHKTIEENTLRAILTDSLAKMNTMVQTSCHIAGNLRNLLNDLREHKFPGEFFDKVQMDRHFEAFSQKVEKVGLEPIFPSATFLWNTKVQSMVAEEDLPVPEDNADAKAEAEANDVGVHVFQKVINDEEPELKATQVKVVLPKANGQDAKTTHEHTDHDLEGSLFKNAKKGMVIYILVTIPLKRRGEEGSTLYKTTPTLMSISPNFSVQPDEGDSRKLHHPVPIQPVIDGGLLVPRMQSSGFKVTEVDDEYLNSCRLVEEVVYICSDTREKSGPPCLTEVFHSQPHSPGCLDHYNLLDPTHPHLFDPGQGEVQLYIPPKTTVFTVCPGHSSNKIWKLSAGLYQVDLPKDCTIKVGGLRYTALTPFTVPGTLTFSQDLMELNQLIQIQQVVEKENWWYLKELLREHHSDDRTLRDLQQRLEETSLQTFTRKNPAALTYYSVVAAIVVIILLLTLAFMLVRYCQATKRRYLAELSRVNTDQEYYRALAPPMVPRTEVEERREPFLRGGQVPAIEYQPQIRELSRRTAL